MIEPLTKKVLDICTRYWRTDIKRRCVGCPIKVQCHQEIPTEEAQIRRRHQLNAAAEEVGL